MKVTMNALPCLLMACKKHPKYGFRRKPKCSDCLIMWDLLEAWGAGRIKVEVNV